MLQKQPPRERFGRIHLQRLNRSIDTPPPPTMFNFIVSPPYQKQNQREGLDRIRLRGRVRFSDEVAPSTHRPLPSERFSIESPLPKKQREGFGRIHLQRRVRFSDELAPSILRPPPRGWFFRGCNPTPLPHTHTPNDPTKMREGFSRIHLEWKVR